MKTKRSAKTAGGSAQRRAFTQTDLNEAVAEMDRKAIAKIIKDAHAAGTDIDSQALLFEHVVSDPNLNNGAAFTTVFCLVAMALKFDRLTGTQRQALALDPRVARAVFPHFALAFPKEADAMTKIYLKSIVEDSPKLWQSVYERAGNVGPKTRKARARA